MRDGRVILAVRHTHVERAVGHGVIIVRVPGILVQVAIPVGLEVGIGDGDLDRAGVAGRLTVKSLCGSASHGWRGVLQVADRRGVEEREVARAEVVFDTGRDHPAEEVAPGRDVAGIHFAFDVLHPDVAGGQRETA